MVELILTLVIIGVILYLLENFVPMVQPIKVAIRVIVVVCLILYLLRIFGLDIPLPRH